MLHRLGYEATQWRDRFFDRFAGHQGVNDEGDTGRNNDPDGARRERQPRCEFGPVTAFAHRFHFHGAKAGEIGERSSRHAGEDHAGANVDVSEAAMDVTEQRPGEVENPPGHATAVHEVAR